MFESYTPAGRAATHCTEPDQISEAFESQLAAHQITPVAAANAAVQSEYAVQGEHAVQSEAVVQSESVCLPEGSIPLLDMALNVGHEELQALRAGEVEMAEACYMQRRHLLEQALVRQNSCDKALLKERLLAMQSLQGLLMEEGLEQRRLLAQQINQGKAQGKRLRGYHQAIVHARAVYA